MPCKYVALPGERVLVYSLDPNAQESLLEAKYETYLNVWFNQAQQAEQLDWLVQEIPDAEQIATITQQDNAMKLFSVSLWELAVRRVQAEHLYKQLEDRGLDSEYGA